MRRYEGSFGRKLFTSRAEASAAVAAELARPPWAQVVTGAVRHLRCGIPARRTSSDAYAYDRRTGTRSSYQAHVVTCQQAPTHAKALQAALLHAPASKAPTRGIGRPLPTTAAGPITALGSDVYTVEALLAHRQRGGKRQFLVR